jgi:F0F1-type ATP synthase membrane subunit b/b'
MLDIDLSLIVVFIIVWILLAVLTRVFFNPLRKVMKSRQDQMDKNRKAAESALESFEQESIRVEEQLREAKALAQTLREKLTEEGQKRREKLLEKTNTDCRSQVEAARDQLNRQVENLKKELDAKSQSLAEQIEKRLIS